MAIDLGKFLRDRKRQAEGAFAQVNPFDGNKTYSTVINNRPPTPQQQPQRQAAPQQRPQQPQQFNQFSKDFGTDPYSILKAPQPVAPVRPQIVQPTADVKPSFLDVLKEVPKATLQVGKSLGKGVYETGDAARNIAQYGAAKATNNQPAANNARQKLGESFQQSIPGMITNPAVKLAQTVGTGLAAPGIQAMEDRGEIPRGRAEQILNEGYNKAGLDLSQSTGTAARKIYGNAGELAFNISTAGSYGAPKSALNPAVRNAVIAGSQGAAGGGLSALQNDNVRVADIAKGAIQGLGSGVVMGVATPYANDVLQNGLNKLQSITPLNKGGYVTAGRTPKNIHPEDQSVMSDFIDYQRGAYKPDVRTAQNLELDASRIAERYGLDMPNSTAKLANVFDQRLQQESFSAPQPTNLRERIQQAKAKVIKPLNEVGAVGEDVRPVDDFGVPNKIPSGLVVSETKPINGQKIQKVRTGKGQVEQRIVDDSSTRIADALGLPKDLRVSSDQNVPQGRTFGDSAMNVLKQPEVTKRLASFGTEDPLPTPDQAPRMDTTNVSAKKLDKQSTVQFEEAANKMLGNRNAAKTRASLIADKLPRLGEKESLEAIRLLDSGGKSTNPKVQQLVDTFRQTTDELYSQYKNDKTFGKNVGYVEEYLPRIYKNPDGGTPIDKQTFDSLVLGTGRSKGREADLLREEALISKDPRELMQIYVKQVEKKQADLNFFKELQNKGLIVEAGSRPKGLQVVDAPGMPESSPFTDPSTGTVYQGNFYADPTVAKQLNKLLSPNEAPKALQVTKNISGKVQQLTMSGGLPGTAVNSFGIANWTKQALTGRPISATKSFLRSFSETAQKNFEKKNSNYITAMEKAGVPYRGTINANDSLKSFGQKLSEAKGVKGNTSKIISEGWNKAVEDPTFQRLLPSLQLDTFKGVYDKNINKGLTPEKSAKIAADATRNVFGMNSLVKDATRSQTANAATSTVFFAPRFRESMINFWVNNAKALGHPTKPEYRENIKFLAGATMLFGATQAANYALNGKSTFQNDNPNDRMNLSIPTKDGNSVSIPFLSSIATIPRMGVNIATDLVTGNPKEAGLELKNTLSQVVRPVADLAFNQKWNGRQIYNPKDEAGTKFKDQAAYVAGGYSQPWIKAAIDAKTKKSSGALETLATAAEAPLRFRDGNSKGTDKNVSQNVNDILKQSEKANTELKTKFSKEDNVLRSLSKAERKKLVDNGAVTEEQLKGLDDYEKDQKIKLGLDLPTEPKAETYAQKYDKALKEYNEPAKKYGPVEKMKKQKNLKYLTVQKDYENDVVALHGMSKADAYNFLHENPDGNRYAEQLINYDNALVKAGLLDKPKYAKGIKPATKYASSSSKGGKGGKGGKGKKLGAIDFGTTDLVSTNKRLQALLGGTTVKAPKNKKVAVKKPKLKKVA